MNKKITIKKALERGMMVVNRVTAIIGVIYMALLYHWQKDFYSYFQGMGRIIGSIVFLLITFISLAIILWFYRSIMITKWKIWAYSNVDNIKKLKKRALTRNILFPKSHFLTRTEIRTSADTQKLESLQIKERNEAANYIFQDDKSVPAEMIIQDQSDKKNILQIVIDDKGISTPETGFLEWSLIQNERIEFSQRAGMYLTFDINASLGEERNSTEEIDMQYYDIETERMEHILEVYRERYEQKLHK
jgi:hypothetical protein